MPLMETAAPSADFTGLKERQRGVWSAGDYALIGSTLQIVGENLCEALDLAAGARILDVASSSFRSRLWMRSSPANRRACESPSEGWSMPAAKY